MKNKFIFTCKCGHGFTGFDSLKCTLMEPTLGDNIQLRWVCPNCYEVYWCETGPVIKSHE